jgi:hypothetical protein
MLAAGSLSLGGRVRVNSAFNYIDMASVLCSAGWGAILDRI